MKSWFFGLGQRLGRLSMRSQLLLGILLPVGMLVGLNAYRLYFDALAAVDTAYDRSLLASAKAIGEQLDVRNNGGVPTLHAAVPYSALEAFEADNRSRMVYKVSGFKGELVSGFEDLPAWHGQIPARGIYAALVDFYDDVYQGEPVRVAVLLQPVADEDGMGMATIQVAETLQLRRTLAHRVLQSTLWHQAALLAVIAAVVWLVVQGATRPVRELSRAITAREGDDLRPIHAPAAPAELSPLIAAINVAWDRQANLLAHQKRFVRDASHQLRTPLAVLKVQVQSAQRGDLSPMQALSEIGQTVDGATNLANQMLALAKVEQLRQQGDPPLQDWADTVREVALDLAPLIADAGLDFELDTQSCPVLGHPWALRELVRNLLHNAVKHSPPLGQLSVSLRDMGEHAELAIADSGPGIAPSLRPRLMQPFASGSPGGAGLGLAICREIVQSMGGQMSLDNRTPEPGAANGSGLIARVRLPIASPPRLADNAAT